MAAIINRIGYSLMTRLLLLIVVLGGFIGAALWISWLVFQSIEVNMSSLSDERLPELQTSSEVVVSTDQIRALLTEILIADTPKSLEQLSENAGVIFHTARTATDQLPAADRTTMQPLFGQAENAVNLLLAARQSEFEANFGVLRTMTTASANADATRRKIEEEVNAALIAMNIKSGETINTIDGRLTQLVDEDFLSSQAALGIRSEINFLTGMSLAMAQNQRSSVASILADLSSSSLDRLKVLLDQVATVPALADVVEPVDSASAIFRRAFATSGPLPAAADILDARLAVDAALTPALDDISFNLIVGNENAKEANRTALTQLLEVEVAALRNKGILDASTKSFFASLLEVASASSPPSLAFLQQRLAQEAPKLREMSAETALANLPALEALLELADPKTGIAAQRTLFLRAQADALTASNNATQAVTRIAQETADFSIAALSKIDLTAAKLAGNVESATLRLTGLSYATLGLLVIAPVFLWLAVIRPIGRVINVTEGLAGGDLSEISDLRINSGELGRMASALHVFRDSALKNLALQEEERAREKAALEEERRADLEKQEKAKRRAEEKASREADERAREAKLAEDAEKQRRFEDARRREQMNEQAHIVNTLAKGLKKLANGDLTAQIDAKFPETYDALRVDFNAAIVTLSNIVLQLSESSLSIEENCSEIATSSLDLAQRTEQNAATLEETVSAIGELSENVAASSEGATVANSTLKDVREQAQLNKDVMIRAQGAMGRVAESSAKITSIVGIIESIAFQTNLLALNAGVEAARAGEAGQGFAVVANEVRVLAQRCTDAASDISEVVTESTSTVEEGVVLTDRANDAMQAINTGIDEISKIVDEFAASASQQAQGLGGINIAVQDLDKSTQKNAAIFEETTASNQRLSQEASALARVVQSFKIKTETETSPSLEEAQMAS
ncbi:MAG: methyl-accepting chemotaxis protein [Pseudomonadota bacterium]